MTTQSLKEKQEAFELEKAELTRNFEDLINKRNQEFESTRSEHKNVLRKLKGEISHCSVQFVQYQRKIEDSLSALNSTKKKRARGSKLCRGSVTKDRTKIESVLQGGDPQQLEPAVVSCEYGKHCTRNYRSEKLGSGEFGDVYLGFDKDLNRKFAIKRVSVRVRDPKKQEQILKTFKREISTLKRARHPNIVALYGYHFEDCEFNCLIYEHLERGNVATYLETEDGRISLTYLRRLRIMAETLRALNYLHTGGCEKGLIIQHRDIKPHNICLTKHWSTKLIDCGLAQFERTDESDNDPSSTINSDNGFSFAGTPLYVCRKYWNGRRPYESACDMYSFGIVMMELIQGRLNGQSKHHPGDFFNQFVESINGDAVLNGIEKLMERCDGLVVWDTNDLKSLCELAVQCLSNNLSERPTAQILASKVTEILVRSEIGGVPGSFVTSLTNPNPNTQSGSSAKRCAVCNEKRIELEGVKSDMVVSHIECDDKHILCNLCVTQEAIVAWRNASEEVPCPIMQCVCKFGVKNLYSIVPQDIYLKLSNLEDRTRKKRNNEVRTRYLRYLKKIEEDQKILISQVAGVGQGVNRGLQAMANFNVRGFSSCPNLVWIVVDVDKPNNFEWGNPLRWPATWTAITDIPIKVYFFCEDTYKIIEKPVEMTVTKEWLRQIAPALQFTIATLQRVNMLVGTLLQLPTVTNFVKFLLTKVDKKIKEKILEKGDLTQFEGVNRLRGRAYKLLEAGIQAGGKKDWEDDLTPVFNTLGDLIWVRSDLTGKYTAFPGIDR